MSARRNKAPVVAAPAAAPSRTLVTPVPGSVLLARGGVWREAPLARHGETLLARLGQGYVRLKKSHETSQPGTSWVELCTPMDTGYGATGYLTVDASNKEGSV